MQLKYLPLAVIVIDQNTLRDRRKEWVIAATRLGISTIVTAAVYG